MCEDNGNGVPNSSPAPEMSSSRTESEETTEVESKIPEEADTLSKTTVQLKLLVPSIAAGSVIGASGQPISEIQERTGTKVKMSKKDDLYPGTNERVCTIVGSIKAVTEVYKYISEKIYEKPDVGQRDTVNRGSTSRHKQAKIIVPNSTAGMIIGKKGTFIEELKRSTNCFIQLSQRSDEVNLPERTVVISGELENTQRAVALLLVKIAEDPQSGAYPNLTYSDFSGPVASAFSSGSPFAEPNRGPISPHQAFGPTGPFYSHLAAAQQLPSPFSHQSSTTMSYTTGPPPHHQSGVGPSPYQQHSRGQTGLLSSNTSAAGTASSSRMMHQSRVPPSAGLGPQTMRRDDMNMESLMDIVQTLAMRVNPGLQPGQPYSHLAGQQQRGGTAASAAQIPQMMLPVSTTSDVVSYLPPPQQQQLSPSSQQPQQPPIPPGGMAKGHPRNTGMND